MHLVTRFAALALLLIAGSVHAEKFTVAAAADLKFCMDELVATYQREHAGVQIDVSYGSSGNFATQIEQGAPFDLFFSADVSYPRALQQKGLTGGEPSVYAIGRLVLWSATRDATKLSVADLAHADIGKVAIANPQHAPYGKRAEEALHAAGVWEAVQPKLVLGENIAQTAQFAASGNADVGLIALSLALNPELARQGGYALVPESLHQPLQQAFVLTQHGADNVAAKAFAEYVQGAPARALMASYGFALPGETPPR